MPELPQRESDINANIKGKPAKVGKGSVVSPDMDKLRIFQLILDQSKKLSRDIERLMSVFLLESKKKFKVYKIQKPAGKTKASVQIADLLFLKDAAIAQKSDASYKAWANYRNLFLSTVKGGEWVKKNAKALNVIVSLA